ncbi:MAG: CxxxxCH/CxxCH domain-containing protein [Minicystis sp.]
MTRLRARPASLAGAVIAAVIAAASCQEAREAPAGGGVHQSGWADPQSDGFHARWLRGRRASNGDELAQLAECRQCHGEDYGGGPVGVSCNTSGCHTQKGGPAFCGTCHGTSDGPMPQTGAHALHQAFCADCHQVPDHLEAKGHVDGKVDVIFGGIAIAAGSKAIFDPATRRCDNVYCHAGSSPTWQAPSGETPCSFCHEAPPASHERWKRVATPTSCATCHPSPSKPEIAGQHIDAQIRIAASIPCWTCHGSAPTGAPAPALDGSTESTSPGVGAHARHLNEALADRIGRAVSCDRCHPIPDTVTSPGHLRAADGSPDTSAPATVVLPDKGVYDPATRTCVVGCHWDRTPGPTWTDASGAARACDACHGFPPLTTRDGTPHTHAEPKLDACLPCHPFNPDTHVDGFVDLFP